MAAIAGAILGFITSFLVLRGSDLTKLMVTLGVALVLGELANQMSWLTGGADGLQGITMGPILGLFEFDIFGTTAYAYSLVVTFLLFVIARRIVVSPYGLSLRAIRDNPLRARAVGIPVNRRLVAVYTLAAAYAGVAGGLLAQTTQFVSLDVLAFHRSADVMLVLVIGGVGYLYGGLIGAVVFKVLQDVLSAWTPQYWQFWIGLILVLLVLAGRERLTDKARFAVKRFFGRFGGNAPARCRPPPLGRSDMAPALETRGLVKRFGGLVATDDVTFKLEQGARHALIGPNGAGKTTFINLLTGVLTPTSGQILLEGEDITRLRQELRVQRGLARTFQINQLFPAMTPLETLGLAVSERMGGGRDWWRVIGSKREIIDEIVEIAQRFRLTDVLDERTSSLAYGKQRLLEIAVAFACRPRVLLLDEPAAGVPEAERHELLATVAALPRDVSVLLIEHDMDLVFSFADRISVLVNGALFTEGTVEEVSTDPRVRAVYLGESVDE